MAHATRAIGQKRENGKGTFYAVNNNRYVGTWYRNQKEGVGTMYYYNGDRYEGQWKGDKRNGRGTYTYQSGAYYKGDWVDDQRTVRASSIGMMAQSTKEVGLPINAMVVALTSMLTVITTMAIGK